MKSFSTMVPLLLLVIAFGCFISAPVVVAEGPWDVENYGGDPRIAGGTTTNGDDTGGAYEDTMLKSGEHPDDAIGMVELLWRVSLRFFMSQLTVSYSDDTGSSVMKEQRDPNTVLPPYHAAD